MRRIPFAAMFFITFIIITGVIISIDISLTETEAFSDNPDLKQIMEKGDGKIINYQQMYKQYDFAKYLNHYYTYSKEDNKNYESPDGVENSKVNSFSITSNNLNDRDGDNKKQQEKQSNRHNDDSKVTKILELDRKNMVEDKTDSSDKKMDKQTYKNVKIIECRNFNINAYELDDLQSVETLLSNPSTFENDEVTQQGKGHSSEKSKEAREYNIGSNTKVIFICNNERYNLSPLNNNNFRDSLSSDGIIVPTSVSKNNYDDARNDEN
ncbi:MAG TPA: hypothetical protein VMS35_03695 [Nitrososphaeraceae archaeon]|nr:hypothetical protein [Nitrososphaeraceae archaeon]